MCYSPFDLFLLPCPASPSPALPHVAMSHLEFTCSHQTTAGNFCGDRVSPVSIPCLAMPCLAMPCRALPRHAQPRRAGPRLALNSQYLISISLTIPDRLPIVWEFRSLALPRPASPRLAQPRQAPPSPATINHNSHQTRIGYFRMTAIFKGGFEIALPRHARHCLTSQNLTPLILCHSIRLCCFDVPKISTC